ncbi:MAG: hypothetical protein HZB92_01810 [Euryarchaeota archaeon]|nr:hypothetical protein [Euryarchaeota archaeon]
MKRFGSSGQSAIFDAVIFLVIMLVASSVLFMYSSGAAWQQDASTRAEESLHAQRALGALLRGDAGNWTYAGLDNATINTTGLSIEASLVQEMTMLAGGVPSAHFIGMNENISKLARALLGDARDWALALSDGQNASLIVISDSIASLAELPAERAASSAVCPSLSGGGDVTITLYVWRH